MQKGANSNALHKNFFVSLLIVYDMKLLTVEYNSKPYLKEQNYSTHLSPVIIEIFLFPEGSASSFASLCFFSLHKFNRVYYAHVYNRYKSMVYLLSLCTSSSNFLFSGFFNSRSFCDPGKFDRCYYISSSFHLAAPHYLKQVSCLPSDGTSHFLPLHLASHHFPLCLNFSDYLLLF